MTYTILFSNLVLVRSRSISLFDCILFLEGFGRKEIECMSIRHNSIDWDILSQLACFELVALDDNWIVPEYGSDIQDICKWMFFQLFNTNKLRLPVTHVS